MRRLVALLGLLAGFACALVFACKSSPVDAGVVVEAGMRGAPVVGSNPGQPFGPCPVGTDCHGTNWQAMQMEFLQQIAMSLDASVGLGGVLTLTGDAAAPTITIVLPTFPPTDGGFPTGSLNQVLIETAGGPGFAGMYGDLRCVATDAGTTFTCTIVALQGKPVDGGGVDGAVLTLSNGQWSPQPAAVANYGLDLAAAADGGQVLVGKTGNDGGAPLPEHTQGWAVDNLQPVWGVTIAAPADAATAPASILLTPAPPNAAAATTAAGTPGGVGMIAGAPLSTGNPSNGFYVVNPTGGSDGGAIIVAQMGLLGEGGFGGYGAEGCIWLNLQGAPISVAPLNGMCGIAGGLTINTPSTTHGKPISFNNGIYGLASLASTANLLTDGLALQEPVVSFNSATISPTIIFNQRVGDTATTTLSMVGQSAYTGAVTNKAPGSLAYCGGNATGDGGVSYVALGSGYTGSTPSNIVCNQQVQIDNIGIEFLQASGTPAGSATQGTIYSDPGGTGELFGLDGTGTPYRLNPAGSCAALTPALCGDLAAVSGAGQWTGSGGQVTTFAPAGSGSVNSQKQHTLSNVFYGRTTGNSQAIAINFTVPTHASGIATFTISGRVVAGTSPCFPDDSIEYMTDEMFNNASGTPADLPTVVSRRSSLSYTNNLSTMVATIGTNYAPNQVGIQIQQQGAGCQTVDWTLKYSAELN